MSKRKILFGEEFEDLNPPRKRVKNPLDSDTESETSQPELGQVGQEGGVSTMSENTGQVNVQFKGTDTGAFSDNINGWMRNANKDQHMSYSIIASTFDDFTGGDRYVNFYPLVTGDFIRTWSGTSAFELFAMYRVTGIEVKIVGITSSVVFNQASDVWLAPWVRPYNDSANTKFNIHPANLPGAVWAPMLANYGVALQATGPGSNQAISCTVKDPCFGINTLNEDGAVQGELVENRFIPTQNSKNTGESFDNSQWLGFIGRIGWQKSAPGQSYTMRFIYKVDVEFSGIKFTRPGTPVGLPPELLPIGMRKIPDTIPQERRFALVDRPGHSECNKRRQEDVEGSSTKKTRKVCHYCEIDGPQTPPCSPNGSLVSVGSSRNGENNGNMASASGFPENQGRLLHEVGGTEKVLGFLRQSADCVDRRPSATKPNDGQ